MEDEDKIKVYEHIKSEIESLIKTKDDKEAHSSKMNGLIEYLHEVGMISEDFIEPEENEELKLQFVKAQLIYDDLQMYTTHFQQVTAKNDALCSALQTVKNILLPLAVLSSNIKKWGKYYQDNDELKDLKSKLNDGLEFANHMRNKITGHLEDEVINNTIQWEPAIFEVSMKDTIMQRYSIYKSLIESAANSYVDPITGKHRIFDYEIDLLFPETSKKFQEYVVTIVNESIDFLEKFMDLLNSKIVYFSGVPDNIYTKAGKTDFKLKKKGR